MERPNSEQYREQTGHPIEKIGSSASTGYSGLDVEQRKEGEPDPDLNELHLREPPSSCVGYGGRVARYREAPNLPGRGNWEVNRGSNENESRYGADVRASDSAGSVEQPGPVSRYGTVHPNAKPSEAGFGSSGPGGYADEGDPPMGSFGDASSKESGICGRERNADELSQSEVRGGVRHGVASDGVSSGAGVTDGIGISPTSSEIEQQQYHLAEVAPSQRKDSPYSQMLTEPQGPSEGLPDRFQEEDITGNTEGGTAVDHHKEATQRAVRLDTEGRLKKLRNKVQAHGHEHNDANGSSDEREAGSEETVEDEKPGVISKLKHKLLANHDKHHDETNPEIFQ